VGAGGVFNGISRHSISWGSRYHSPPQDGGSGGAGGWAGGAGGFGLITG
jgi:hypothetical protein